MGEIIPFILIKIKYSRKELDIVYTKYYNIFSNNRRFIKWVIGGFG